MMWEAAQARSGVPFLGQVMYPAIDTYGWESALSLPRSQALFNPSGVVTLQMEPKAFVPVLVEALGLRNGP